MGLSLDLFQFAFTYQRRRIKRIANLQQGSFNLRAGAVGQLFQLCKRLASGRKRFRSSQPLWLFNAHAHQEDAFPSLQ